MDIRQIEFFVAAAGERTFTRAAQHSHVSQPGLSAAIRSLESELGAQLFVRSARGAHLTPAGRSLLPRARRMLADAAAARLDIRDGAVERGATLRIGAEPCLGVLVDLVDLVSAFRSRSPSVALSLSHADSASLLMALRLGELDVAVVADIGERPLPATTFELASEGFELVSTPGSARARSGSLRDLAGETFVDLGSGWGSRTIIDRTFADHGLTRRVEFEVGDVHTLLQIVHRGLAFAIVPAAVAAKPQADGLVRIPLDEVLPPWRVLVALDERPPVVADAFADLLIPAGARRAERLPLGPGSQSDR